MPDEQEQKQTEDPAEEPEVTMADFRRKACRTCELWDQAKDKVRIMELLEASITKLEERFRDKDFKPTIADYLKLLQLERDFEQDEIKEIKVTWVEPPAPSVEK